MLSFKQFIRESKTKRRAQIQKEKPSIPRRLDPKRNRANPLDKEQQQIDNLSGHIERIKSETGRSHVPVRINGRIYRVASLQNIKGNPKADFAFHDEDGNPVYHISHKIGSSPKHFLQLGGVSKKEQRNTEAVSSFDTKLKKMRPKGMEKGDSFSTPLDQDNDEHRKLAHHAVFGHEHGGEYGKNNVNSLIQGDMSLTADAEEHPYHGRVYNLVSSGHQVHNENNPNQRLPFETEILARRASDRNDLGNQRARIGIHAVGGRKTIQI